MTGIWYDHRLLELPERLNLANGLLAAAIGEGSVPADRPDLTGGEEAVFAFVKDLCVGIAAFYQPDGHDLVWLDLLFVEPEFRRKGIATELLRRVSERAVEMGVPKLSFGTLTKNSNMQTFGALAGFERESVTYARRVAA